jgi:hypothetical protein
MKGVEKSMKDGMVDCEKQGVTAEGETSVGARL